jgi:hypothetical protein
VVPPTPLRWAGFRRLPHALATLLLAAIALLVPALPATAATAGPEADTVYSLLNDARSANGQSALVRNASLDDVATAWASELAASGVLSHNPSYPQQIPAGWSEAGENVARGQWTATEMHTDWMNSPGHRANILGNFTDVGIAWLTDATGMTWGVQVFANYPAPVVAVAPPEITAELETLVTSGPAEQEPAADSATDRDVDDAAATAPSAFGGFELLSVSLAAGILLAAMVAVVVILRRRARAS